MSRHPSDLGTPGNPGGSVISRRIGPPCGCPLSHHDDECPTLRPLPRTNQFCVCSSLGIEFLRKPEALAWHAAGHPTWAAA